MLRMLPNKLFHPDAQERLSPAEMTDYEAQALASYKAKTRVIPGHGTDAESIIETTYEYKLVDRKRAAELLARYHGLFDKDNRQRAPQVPQALVAFPSGTLDPAGMAGSGQGHPGQAGAEPKSELNANKAYKSNQRGTACLSQNHRISAQHS
jgi:hypothetical protein